jgi:signal transduction histidine kinase/DNA-binding response OmpR family regulator
VENSKGIVLVVDDNPSNVEFLAALLTLEGYATHSAYDGESAIEAVKQHDLDLVLLDILLPHIDGYEVCRRLKADPETRDLPIILVSAIQDETYKARGFEVGAVDYISKPIPHLEMLARIDNQLRLCRLQRQLEERNQQLQVEIQQRIRVEETLRQQAERERLITAVTQQIHQSLNLADILEAAVVEIRQVLQTDRVLIYRLDKAGTGRVIAESVQPDSSSMLGAVSPILALTDRDRTFRQGKLEIITDIESDEVHPLHRERLQTLGIRASLVMPILQGHELWGLLAVHAFDAPQTWQAWQLDLLRQLSAQLAIAIQQSELYGQVQAFSIKLEQQVKERTAELELASELEATLKRITDKVRDSLDEGQILQTAVEELVKGLRIDCCNAALFDLEQRTSTIYYEYTVSIPPSQGRVSNMDAFPELYEPLLRGEYLQFCSLMTRPGQQPFAMLCCPIQDETSVLGDLWLIHQAHHMFTVQDIRLVQQVANQCAIALRQARLYQAAQRQVQELEQLNQLKDDFLSTVSHELRTPMTNIKMATQMLEVVLQREGLLSHGGAVQYFDILRRECQREISLINDLLDLTRLSSQAATLDYVEIDLRDRIPRIADPFTERTRQHQQHLQLNIPDNLPPMQTEPSYLERIVSELLNNACKYTPAGEKITVGAAADLQSNRVVLQVSNSGTEIPTQERDRIFEKFHRIPRNDPWKHGGTGLGLALVKGLVERLEGHIHVDSANQLTTFTVQLPLVNSEAQS